MENNDFFNSNSISNDNNTDTNDTGEIDNDVMPDEQDNIYNTDDRMNTAYQCNYQPPQQPQNDIINRRKDYFTRAGYLLLIVILIYLGISFIGAKLYELELPWLTSPEGTCIFNAVAITLITILLPAIIFMRGFRAPQFNTSRVSVKMLIISVGAGVAVCFAAAGINGIFQAIFEATGADLSIYDTELPNLLSVGGFTLVTVTSCLLPAVCEETLFRGAVMYSWRSLGKYKAALISGALFGMLHMSLPSLPALFFIGYILGLVAYDSRSMYPTMIMHFMNNFISVLLSAVNLLPQFQQSSEQVVNVSLGDQLLSSAVIGVLGGTFLWLCLSTMKKTNAKKRVQLANERNIPIEQIIDEYEDKQYDVDALGNRIEVKRAFPVAPVVIMGVLMLAMSVLSLVQMYEH